MIKTDILIIGAGPTGLFTVFLDITLYIVLQAELKSLEHDISFLEVLPQKP